MANFLDIFELELRKQALVNSEATKTVAVSIDVDLVAHMASSIPLMQNAELLAQLADVVRRVRNEQG